MDPLGRDALPAGSTVAVTYRAPTRPGDEITSDLRDAFGDVEAECVNQDGVTVVSIRARLAGGG